MAALNFPANPVNGQTYTFAGRVWIYSTDEGAWQSTSNLGGVLSVAGKTGDVTLSQSDISMDGDLTAISALTGMGILRRTGTNTWELDTTTYLSGNQTITLSGDVSGSGATAISVTLANTGVTAGSYGSSSAVPVITVDGKGRITSVSTSAISGSLTFTGDVTGTGTTGSSTTLTLSNTGVSAGTYTKVTVDAKGRVTSATTLSSSDLPTYTGTITSSQVTTALGFTPENAANKGVANGYASLDASAKVPAAQLPSYVDDVLEYANLAAFPAAGTAGLIYVALDSNKVYRWTGSTYVEISPSPGTTDSLTEGSTNLYFTTARARDSVSAAGSLSYNAGTGVFSYTQPTNVSTFSNDAGYITNSALSGYLTSAAAATTYLALAGGTVTGSVNLATTSGSVGIGTAAPGRKLTVAATNAQMSLQSANTGYSEYYFSDVDGDPGYLSYNHNTEALIFGVNSGEAARFTSTRSFLVGAANADVGGSVKGINLNGSIGKILVASNTAGMFYEPLYVDRMNTAGDGAAIVLAREGYYKAAIGVLRGGSVAAEGSMVFYTGTNSDWNVRMQLDPSGLSVGGNVGIGTTSPGGKLHVVTGGISTWAPFVVTSTTLWGDGSTEYVTIGAGGASGIMIHNPHVVWNATNSAAAIRLGRSGGVVGGAWYEIGTKESDAFWISKNAGATPQLYIDGAGKLGIGTTSPLTALHVEGIIASRGSNNTTDSLRLYNSDGNYAYLRTTSTGNSNNLWIDPPLGAYIIHAWDNPGSERTADTYTRHFFGIGRGTTNEAVEIRRGDMQGRDSSANVVWRIATGVGGLGSSTYFSTNVGIGTTSPSYRLVVSNAGGVGGEFDPTGVQIAGGFGIQAYNRTTAAYVPLQLYGSKVILGGGNVGIGTADPDARLHVFKGNVGSGAVADSSLALQYDGTTTYGRHFMDANGFYVIYAPNGGVSGGNISLWADTSIQFRVAGVVSDPARMILDSTGRLGIGTTSPLAKLSVGSGSLSDSNVPVQISTGAATGLVYFGANKNGGYGALFGYDNSSFGGAVVRSVNSGESISFVVNNTSEAVRIISTGNVGIGTTAPTDRLTVQSGGIKWGFPVGAPGAGDYGYEQVVTTTANDLASGTVRAAYGWTNPADWYVNGNDAWKWKLAFVARPGSGGNYNTQFEIQRSTRGGVTDATAFAISRDGNVGIGTTSPQTRLHIVGASTTGADFGAELRVWENTFGAQVQGSTLGNTYAFFGNFRYNFATEASSVTNYFQAGHGILFKDGVHIFSSAPGGTSGGTFQPAERLTITNSGNVGIGTKTPSYQLAISNNGAAGIEFGTTNGNYGEIYAYNRSTSAYIPLVIQGGGGNVGIGTTSPTHRLVVNQGNSGGVAAIHLPADESTIQGPSANTQIRMGGNLVLTAASVMTLSTNGSEHIRITSGGNVGIGTTSPSSRLDVNGTIASSGTQVHHYFVKNVTGGRDVLVLRSGTSESSETDRVAWIQHDRVSASAHKWNFWGSNDGTSTQYNMLTLSYNNGDGNVGIGTAAPNRQLTFGSKNEDAINIRRLTTGEGAPAVGTGISWTWTSASTDNETWAAIRVIMPGQGNTHMTFSTTTSNGQTNLSEKMRILDNGNVGIGTTSPGFKLDVNGSIYANGDIRSQGIFRDYQGEALIHTTAAAVTQIGSLGASTARSIAFLAGNAEAVRVTTAGNVGVGTTGPVQYISGTERVVQITSSNAASLNLESTNGGVWIWSSITGNTLRLYSPTYGDYVMTATTAGCIGIGTATPYGKLSVTGAHASGRGIVDIRSSNSAFISLDSGTTDNGLRLQVGGVDKWLVGVRGTESLFFNGSNDTTLVTFTQGGNVGVGTTNPTQQLHITGYARMLGYVIDETGGTRSAFVGYEKSWIGSGSSNSLAIAAETGNSLKFYTNGSATLRMAIDTSGNVGIGTTSPSYKLDIGGAGSDQVAVRLTPDYGRVRIHGYDLLGYNGGNLWAISNTSASELTLGTSWDWDRQISITYAPNTTGAAGGNLVIGQQQKNNANWTQGSTAFWTNGTERLLINSSGHVGIGTSSVNSRLTVSGSNSSSTPLLDLTASGTGTFQRGVRLLNSGMNVGDHIMYAVGRADGSYNMGQFYFYYAGSGSTSNRISMGLHSVDDVFNVVGTGRVGIGTTGPSYKLHVVGDVYATADVIAYSDARIKTNVATIDSALDKVMALRGVYYDRIDEPEKGRRLGVIAQEVKEVLPEVVSYAADADQYSVAYGNIVGVLIEAVKEQQGIIRGQQARIERLELLLEGRD